MYNPRHAKIRNRAQPSGRRQTQTRRAASHLAEVVRSDPQIQWVESFVTADKIYCIYMAPDEVTVRQHAQQGGFPANHVAEVKSRIDPTTAE